MNAADLATRQLAAYNAAQLDDFCACYHPDVVVLNGSDEVVRGAAAFRARYEPLFSGGGFGATVSERICHADHCVELEHWWRIDAEGARTEGTVIVHYTVADGLISVVRFYR